MAKTTFIVSDETINSYGFVVLTAGIDTAYFEKNPVMFYMHNRENGIVGRWENLRKENGKLLADAVFDDSTELAKQVQNQVLKGFLRSASIGIDNVVKDNVNGVETVIKCCLVEISIVDIPSNKNAVKLYRKKGGFVYDLARLNDDEITDLRATLIALLGLSDNASDTDIYDTVKNAINTENSTQTDVDNAVKNGYIDAAQTAAFLSWAKSEPTAFAAYIQNKKQTERDTIKGLIDNAVNEFKIIPNETAIYQTIGEKVGIKAFKQLLFSLKSSASLIGILKMNEKTKEDWSLDDYRKYDPEALKNNPELYKRLLEKEGEKTPERSLDWYRKNAPETLRNNPELYKTLTNKK